MLKEIQFMRLKGKLINWDNDKAFGFIVPNNGGKDIFIHKSAFYNRQRTPKINDIITFSIGKDEQGRECAEQATYSGEKLKKKRAKRVSKFSIYLVVIFFTVIFIALITGYMPLNLILVYLGMSIVTFIQYALDKSRAKRKAWRIPEKLLHLLALTGGWPGAAIAQEFLRHKSQKKAFRIVFWITVIANCGILAWLMTPSGSILLSLFW